jgi:uncharacterized protein YidB (DUF937 family)
MAVFDTLIGDTASRFGLGSNAGQLVRETLNMVANAPGGIAGFLGKLEAAGLRSEMQSWLGHPNAAPLSAQDLDRALGSGALSGIANRLGIAETAVKTAVGYTLPKLIGALTPGGRIPTSLPAEVETFLSSRVAEPGTRPVSGSAERFVERRTAPESLGVIQNESTMSRWRLPLVGALAALAIGALLYNRTPVAPDIAQAPSALPAIAEDVKTAAATVTESVQRGANLALTEQAAKAWVDRPVYSSDGQKLGEVAAFLRTADNKVSELQADIGGFLGIGEHRVRLAPGQFSFHSDRIVLDLTAAEAKELPKIQK